MFVLRLLLAAVATLPALRDSRALVRLRGRQPAPVNT